MATNAKDRKRRSSAIILVLLGALALCLIAWAAGWVGSPFLDSLFGRTGSGQSAGGGGAGADGSGGGGDGGGGDEGGGDGGGGSCFLNLICFNASGSGEGVDAAATVQP